MNTRSNNYSNVGHYDNASDAINKQIGGEKRRALGDITNQSSINSKKPVNYKPLSSSVLNATTNVTSNNDREKFMIVDDDEKRPYMLRASDDIDSRDAGNPIQCSSCVNEMYDHFNSLENEYLIKSYLTLQTNITEHMRCILIDWLIEVHLKFKMVPETLYLTINLIDRFLQFKVVRRSRLQLVGVAALLLASKYEEIYYPEIKELIYITDRSYTKREILEMETEIANTLNYQLTVPNSYTFLCRYLKAAHADKQMVQLACYIAERSLQEYSMTAHLPSTIAATCIMIARKILKKYPWSPTLVKYTKYDEEDLQVCQQDIGIFLHVDSSSGAQNACYRKYAAPKFDCISKVNMKF